MKTFSNFFRSVIIGPLAALVIVVVVISLTTDRFLTPANLTNVSLQVSTVAIAAIGSTIVILTGGIDLSPGAVVALTSSVLAVLVQKTGLSLPAGIILALLLGVLLGGFNGLLSTYLRIPSFTIFRHHSGI